MNDLTHHLYTQACNNAWSNLRLLRACMQLSDVDFAARRTSFFPSLRATLNHNLTVDWFYVDALERALAGRALNPDAARFFDPPEPFATCAPLAHAQRAVDTRLMACCAQLTDLTLLVAMPRGARVQREPVVRLLSHVFQHQVHHRGQAHAMLAGTHVPPPQLDEFFAVDDAPRRALELPELGLSEAGLWGPTQR